MGFEVKQKIRTNYEYTTEVTGLKKIAYERNPVIVQEDTGSLWEETEGMSFRDPALQLTQALSPNVPYLLHFAIKLDTNEKYHFKIKLQRDLTGEAESEGGQVAERTIKEIYTPFGLAENYAMDVVFSTKESYWERIVFEKYRVSDDYSNDKNAITNGEINNWIVETGPVDYYNGSWLPVHAESVKLSTINALIPDIDEQQSSENIINKIGIQGPPGMIFTLDNEGLKIGKTGIYQISYDTLAVKRIGVAPEANDFFIIDYRIGYETSSDQSNAG